VRRIVQFNLMKAGRKRRSRSFRSTFRRSAVPRRTLTRCSRLRGILWQWPLTRKPGRGSRGCR